MNFIKTVLAVLVAQFLLVFTLMFGLVAMSTLFSRDTAVHVADGSWLVIDVYGQIPPYNEPESISSSIFDEGETETRILESLEKAAVDKRIDGVIMKISSSNSLGLASLGEIRDAIARVRAAEKPVLAFSALAPLASARNTVPVALSAASLYIFRLPNQRGCLSGSGRNTPM